MNALVEAGVDELVSFEEFAETLEQQRAELIEAHQCRDVRFEVTIHEGDVSLQPHLVR